ncbi:MAG: DNA repair protein RecO [Myxococcota bacterium]
MPRWIGEALVLRAVEFGESDRIVHLLTPERGRIAAIAKGARRSVKRFPGTLDVFNHIRVHAERRRRQSMIRLDQAILLRPFLGLRLEATRYGLASYLLELLDRLAPESGPARDMARLFDFALAAMGLLESASPDPATRVWIELRALDALGLRPELRHCVRCGAPASGGAGPDRVAFHVGEGGVLCGACSQRLEGALQLHVGTLRTLERGLDFDLALLGRLSLRGLALAEAEALARRFLRFHVGLELRSERFLDEILPASQHRSPP